MKEIILTHPGFSFLAFWLVCWAVVEVARAVFKYSGDDK